jgi:hypothetical protein
MRDDIPVATSTTSVLSNPNIFANETLVYECDVTGNSGNFTGGVAYSKCSDKGYGNLSIQTGYFLYPWLKATVNYTSLQDGLNPSLAFGIGAWVRANASLTLTYTRPTKDFIYTQTNPDVAPAKGNHSVNTLALTTGFAF